MTLNEFSISDTANDYSRYDLQENPFPYSPVPDDDPTIYCGQKHVTNTIRTTVSTTLSTGKSRHLVITGKYGNGKSHTLKYTRSLLRNRDDAVVGYVAQPGEGFLDIYHEFMYDLGFERLQRLSYEYLAHVANDVTDASPQSVGEMATLLDEGEVLLSDLVPETIRRLSDVTGFADFARAVVHLVYDDTNLYAWQWLTGEGIRYEQRKEMEIHSALDDDTTGVRAFTALKDLLLNLGYTGVFVFIDEFESIAHLSSKDEQSVLNSIRHLMDRNSTGLCLLFGCAPEVWQDVMSEYHAFSERIGEEAALKPLTEEYIRELIVAYLDTARSAGDGIEPFTDEALSEILRYSQGNIRQALAACSRVIDRGVETGRSRLTAEVVQEAI